MRMENGELLLYDELISKTEKAVKIRIKDVKIWIPISVCVEIIDEEDFLTVQSWFYEKELKSKLEECDGKFPNTRGSVEEINDLLGVDGNYKIQGVDYSKNTYGCSPDELGEDYFSED